MTRLPLLLLQVGEAWGPGREGSLSCWKSDAWLGRASFSSELPSGRGVGPSGPLRPTEESSLPEATQ